MRCWLLGVVIVLAGVQPLRAQGGLSGRLHGTVSDSASGTPLVGATVQVVDPRRAAITTAEGHFELTGLPAIAVTVTIRAVGYAPAFRRIDLARGDGTLDVRLAASAVQLQELSVTGDSAAPGLRDAVSRTTLLEQDIGALRGQTLGETIRELPGVAVIQYGPAQAKPVIRGLSSQRILLMNSGVRQEGQQWGAEHAPEIDTFEASTISVIRGTGAVLYGPDALGGVVQVERAPLPAAGPLRGTLAMNVFSNNAQAALSGMVEGTTRAPLLGLAGYRLRLTGRRAQDARTPDYFLPNTGFNELNGSVALGVARPAWRSEFLYSLFNTHLGVYSGSHVGNVDDLERAMEDPRVSDTRQDSIGRPDQRVIHHLSTWRTTWDLPRNARFDLNVGAQYNWRREYDNHGPLRNRDIPAFDLRLTTLSVDGRYQHQPVGRMVGTVGATAMYQWNFTAGKAFLIPSYQLGMASLFAQEDLVLNRWTLSAGVRGDYIGQQTEAYDDVGIVSPAERRNWSSVSASSSASYLLSDRWSVALRLARGWRAPNVNERFAQGVHHGTAQFELGDTSLVPEKKFGPELSLQHQGGNLQLELTGYWNRIDGFIYLQPIEPRQTIRGAFPAFQYAQTNATLAGMEALANWYPRPWLSLQAAVNVIRGQDRINDQPLFDMPADRANLSARYIGTSSGALHQWHVEVGTLLVRQQDRVPPNTIYSLPTDAYQLINAEAGVTELHVLGTTFDAVLAVQNLFNVRFRDYLSRFRLFVDDPGRNVVLRLTVPFGGSAHRSS
jgi:iron complex outermembrane receptor protein